jgi:hypothetical protein
MALYARRPSRAPAAQTHISKCRCEKSPGLFVFGASVPGSLGRGLKEEIFCGGRFCWQYEVVVLGTDSSRFFGLSSKRIRYSYETRVDLG